MVLNPFCFSEICEDVQEECSKYGSVLEIKIPRPTGSALQDLGVGKIYVKFENADSATKALKALAGRKFQDRTVVTSYFSEVRPSPIIFTSYFSRAGRSTWLTFVNFM